MAYSAIDELLSQLEKNPLNRTLGLIVVEDGPSPQTRSHLILHGLYTGKYRKRSREVLHTYKKLCCYVILERTKQKKYSKLKSRKILIIK